MERCEDELICDFAEYYNIYDYKRFPPILAGTFLVGLRDYSRVKMFISKNRITLDQMLYARMIDALEFIAWSKTKDGQKGRNRPESVLQSLLHPEKSEKDNVTYASGEDFRAAWDKIMEDKKNG